MISTKTSAKVLKRMGIVLVTMPEPFTTPVGVACIIASQCLSRRIEQDRLNLIHKKKANRFPDDFVHPNEVNHNNNYDPQRVNFYSYDKGQRYNLPVQYKYNYTAKSSPRPVPVLPVKSTPSAENCKPMNVNMERLFQIKSEELARARTKTTGNAYPDFKMIPRKVNLDALARRYQEMESRTANFNDSRTTGKSTELVRCTVNTKLLAQYKEMERMQNDKPVNVAVPEIRPCVVDAEELIKRYNKIPNSKLKMQETRTARPFLLGLRPAMGFC
jgi:hypothetical protein